MCKKNRPFEPFGRVLKEAKEITGRSYIAIALQKSLLGVRTGTDTDESLK